MNESARAGGWIAALIPSVILAALVCVIAAQLPADAVFPGQNGRIAYQRNGDVWTMRSDGTDRVRLTNSNTFEGNPAFSPDGSYIAYENGRAIWVMNASGTGKKALTNGRSFDYDPAWSPNGRKIAYTSVGCDGTSGGLCVFDMNPDGTNQRNLTPEEFLPGCSNVPSKRHLGNSSEPNYSPNGTQIVFSGVTDCENSRGRDVWIMSADGSGKVNLNGDDGTDDVRPAFSPTGTRIVFGSSGRGGANEAVFTMSTTGEGITRLVVANDNSAPDWGVKR